MLAAVAIAVIYASDFREAPGRLGIRVVEGAPLRLVVSQNKGELNAYALSNQQPIARNRPVR
ncbi:MAG: hypothetical protein GY854_17650 [Deltaproteobacteria bacterium]|nr:hypothetical protein [Deltaproteobacteria bacterium]